MAVASAQETTGTLTGKLTDGQGLALPGVTVTVSGTQGSRSFVTDGEGQFRAPFLVPGSYDVRAELSGFKAVEQKGVPVSLGQTTSVNLQLEVGGISETVSVTAATSIVDTTSTTTGAVITADMLSRVPVGRRSATRCTWRPASAPRPPARRTRRWPARRSSTTSTWSTA